MSASREKCGERANPRSPPSPAADTPGTVMAVRGRPPLAAIRRIFPVVRSATSASPPGRKAIPQGTWSPVATVRRVGTRGDRVGAAVAVMVAGGDAVAVSVGAGEESAGVVVARGRSDDDEPHAARTSAAAAV